MGFTMYAGRWMPSSLEAAEEWANEHAEDALE